MPRLLVAFALVVFVHVQTPAARANEAEDKVIDWVKQLDGRIKRDDQPGKPVVEVRVHRKQVTDADLKQLAVFKKLTQLDLGGTKVTEAAVNELRKALPQCSVTRDP